MIALQALRDNQQNLSRIEDELSTGLAVASPKDDGAVFAISQNMRGLVKSYDALMQANDRTLGLLDVTVAASQSISDTLIEMRKLALSATDPSLSAADRAALNDQFLALKQQVDAIAKSATYNGQNLIDSSGSNFVQYGSGAVPAGTNMAEWGATPRTTGQPKAGEPLTLRFGFDGSGQQAEDVGGTVDFNLRYFDSGSWNVVPLGSSTVPTSPPPQVGPGQSPYTVQLDTTVPVLPDTASDVQIYAEYVGKVPEPDGKAVAEVAANGDPSSSSAATNVPHLLMQWRDGDWASTSGYINSYWLNGSASGSTDAQVTSGGVTTAGTVHGNIQFFPQFGVTTQVGINFTPYYEVFDPSQGTWVRLAAGAAQSVPVGTVSASAPINAPYSITIPAPPAGNADFTQARVALDMWVNASGAGNFETLPVIAQSDGTAAVFPSTRQVEITTKINALAGVDGRNVPIRQNNSTSSVAALSLRSAGLSSQAGAQQALDLVDGAQKRVLAQTQYYAAQSKAFSISKNFEGKLVDELNTGIGRLVDADMSKAAAKLSAARTQQQLAVQSLAISNSLPNLVLSLFQVH